MDQFERAGGLGLEPAAAYLALMAGTDATNTTSSWGINAISENTGLTRHEAKGAVGALIKVGLGERAGGGQDARPHKAALSAAGAGQTHPAWPGQRACCTAVDQEWVSARDAGSTPGGEEGLDRAGGRRVGGDPAQKPTVAFVPNTFVRTERGSAPLARLLNAGEIDALMLAVRLYRKQNLMESRGVPPEDVRQHFRAHVSQLGQHPYRVVCLERRL